MKYKQLKHLINLIKQTIHCPECKKMYHSDQIDLVDIYEDEGVVNAYCPSCNVGVSISVDVQQYSSIVSPKVLHQANKTEISNTEVEDISNTLKKHKGGIRELLT